jgi:hypothetical protein
MQEGADRGFIVVRDGGRPGLSFSAAFPFFNNVDERRHFDLVMKYASGHLPRGAELISPATLPYLSRYASPEFLAAPENFEGGYYGPLWTHPAEEIASTLAAIPQDAFYGIENDVLSPICFGITFICLVRWFREERPRISLGIVTGSSIAAAYLTKLSNLPLIVVAIGAIAYWCAGRVGSRKLRDAIPALSALVCCAAIPIAAWMIWIKSNFGDFTGSATKAELLGWTAKPFSDWWSHPIFTLSGFWTFLAELIASFWRGEFMWHAHTIGWKGMDMFYVVSSLGFFLVAGVSLLRRRTKDVGAAPRRALWIAAASFIAAIAFLGFLSLQFDFGSCINPSRERPYFFQGRLMSGAMIPFALLYVYGLHRLLRAVPALVLPVLVAIATAITISESFANGVAFASVYNWFHM